VDYRILTVIEERVYQYPVRNADELRGRLISSLVGHTQLKAVNASSSIRRLIS